MKNLCLDIGNVIFDVDVGPFLDKLSEVTNTSLEDVERALKRFHHLHDLGFTTIQEEIKDRFGIKSQVILSQLIDEWNASIYPRPDIINKFYDLSLTYHFDIALLSNIGVEHARIVKKLLHKSSISDFYQNAKKHFSCEVGARKPHKLFYQSFLQQYPQFEGAVYVDDLIENLESSKQFGFQTIHMSLEQSNIESKMLEIEKLILS